MVFPAWKCGTKGRAKIVPWPCMRAYQSCSAGYLKNAGLGRTPALALRDRSRRSWRDRTLTDKEIVAFWHAAEAERPETAAASKLLLLTGQRLTEVTDMRRGKLSDQTWIIPSNRTKNGREHVVPLASPARDILAAALPAQGDHVFSVTGGRKPIIVTSAVRERLVAATGGGAWRIHDLRRSVATGMAELGIPPHIVEAVLNHVSGAKAGVAGTYNRAAYAAEKKAALERWAAHIAGLIDGKAAKVVQFRRRTRKLFASRTCTVGTNQTFPSVYCLVGRRFD